MSKNHNLTAAKKAKNDEFYTRREDIEAELMHYADHFCGKVVYCNCDDPESSEFWKFFMRVFEPWGLKKLIATHYEPNAENFSYMITAEPAPDGSFSYLQKPVLTPLPCNGDFRSAACIELLKEADIVVTNPPFSLFREYIAQLVEYGKEFLVIGNMNAITYKEIFPLIRENGLWLGFKALGSEMYFSVSEEYQKWLVENKKAGSAYKIIDGVVMGRMAAACWFTNLDHKKRHQPLDLRGNYYHGNESQFPKYDNYDAIEVSKVAEIPCDYFEAFLIPTTALASLDSDKVKVVNSQAKLDAMLAAGEGSGQYIVRLYENHAEVLTAGHSKEDTAAFLHAQGVEEADMRYQSGVMGVPITFLDKYCPEQFEIVAFRKGDDGKDLVFTREREKEFNRIFISLCDKYSESDKECRGKDLWADYMRSYHSSPEGVEPVDIVYPLATNLKNTLVNNCTVYGKKTYVRLLVRRR